MKVTVFTYDERSYEVNGETAVSIAEAMSEGWQHIHIPELNITLAIKDIRRMENVLDPSRELPSGKKRISMPRDHDVVVLDAQNQIIRTYKKGGFYSEEATVLRRAENKINYMPGWQREALQKQRKREEKAAATSGFMAE